MNFTQMHAFRETANRNRLGNGEFVRRTEGFRKKKGKFNPTSEECALAVKEYLKAGGTIQTAIKEGEDWKWKS